MSEHNTPEFPMDPEFPGESEFPMDPEFPGMLDVSELLILQENQLNPGGQSLTEESSDFTDSHEPEPPMDGMPPYISPSLLALPENRRPNPSTLCEVCPAAMWIVLPMELRCFCRDMHRDMWSQDQQTVVQVCDGKLRAEMEIAAAMEKKK